MKNCRIEEETDDSYINNTLIIVTGTYRMDLKNGFAVFLSQASVFNKILSKIFIELERLSMP